MSSPTSQERTDHVTRVVMRVLTLRDAGNSPRIEDLCDGDSDLARDVHEQLTCVESIGRLFDATTPQLDAAPAATPASVPRTLDRYELREMLGKGGFGQVWLAHDPVLNLKVALKIPRPDLRLTEEQLGQFLLEARKAAALAAHPNIVKVRDVQRRGMSCYIVSDYIDGNSLWHRLSTGRLSHRESADIAETVADALHHAHLHGYVHRDVKPHNILLNKQGVAYLTDFGLAISEEEQPAEPGAVRGSIGYMSPEQARGDSNQVDSRTDVYGLGVVLYQMLTNRLPHVASSWEQYRVQIRDREPRPPRTIDDSIPVELESICLKCLRKPREERYTTAKDVADAIRRWKAGPTKRRIHPWTWAASALATVLAGAVLFLLLRDRGDPERGDEPKVIRSPERRHFDPKRDILTPGEWHSLLQWEPKRIHFPGELHWKPKHPYLIHCEEWGMISFGELPAAGCRLKVTLKQTPWVGNVSIFLGYHEAMTTVKPIRKVARYQLVRVVPWKGINKLLIDRGYFEDAGIDQPGRAFTPEMLNGSVLLSFPEERYHTLEFDVDPQGLRSFAWDDRPTTMETDEANRAIVNLDPRYQQGAFGLQLLKSTTQLGDFQIKVRRKEEAQP